MHLQPPLDAVRAHYDAWNAECRDADFDSIEPEIRVRAEIVLQELRSQGRAFDGILEIGCGTGWMTDRLRAFGPITAIDLSPRAIEIARRRGLDARFIAGDFLAEPFAPASFDAVVCVETLFYVQDQQAVVRKMAELLRPGGSALITCINPFVYERRRDIGPPKPGQPRHWLTRRQLRALVAQYLRVDRERTVEPSGDLGILRFVNAPKLDAACGRLIGAVRLKRLKEKVGLGGGVVLLAHRPA